MSCANDGHYPSAMATASPSEPLCAMWPPRSSTRIQTQTPGASEPTHSGGKVPFGEDLRSDPAEHRHGLRFAKSTGVEALLDAVHREDVRRR
jgi:hypothetical protein